MRQELLDAIQTGETWLKQFNRQEYGRAFKTYVKTYGAAYMEETRAAEGKEELLRALADQILNGLEEGRRKQRFWNRSVARTNEKMTIVQYLSPMLLGLEEPGCKELARLLRDGWNARYPKDKYEIASYERIRKGFRNVILGLDLGSLNRNSEEDEEEP